MCNVKLEAKKRLDSGDPSSKFGRSRGLSCHYTDSSISHSMGTLTRSCEHKNLTTSFSRTACRVYFRKFYDYLQLLVGVPRNVLVAVKMRGCTLPYNSKYTYIKYYVRQCRHSSVPCPRSLALAAVASLHEQRVSSIRQLEY